MAYRKQKEKLLFRIFCKLTDLLMILKMQNYYCNNNRRFIGHKIHIIIESSKYICPFVSI